MIHGWWRKTPVRVPPSGLAVRVHGDPGKIQKRGDVRKEKSEVARRTQSENVIEVTFLLDFP